MAIGVTAGLFLLAAVIWGPSIWRNAASGIAANQELRTPPIAANFAGAAGTWINPWLRDKAQIMMNATLPVHWRGTSFQLGPCTPENLSLLPTNKWHQAIIDSCHDLDDIQVRYQDSCLVVDCVIPDDAKRELQAVIDFLVSEYSDIGSVEVTEQTAQ